ncbi:hypothetical protein HNR60_000543 [Rhodopseudomonas rhenobacensis]|uniref:Uncharacterized protein n=1 Tax=Rhodopseudomonas rhenobacensis TaxID=87461 RepID=A0A7W7Z0R9_9BRAD|nr:hypothetical protein [Rhodopseudomonas rhenobacensis]MBB5045808.1 hypothetical protein [Rhodopseudomonas rhenobacensis]
MALWKTIKNLFIPWNLITPDASEADGVRTVDLGQIMIDGATGDVSDTARILEHGHPAPPAPPPGKS